MDEFEDALAAFEQLTIRDAPTNPEVEINELDLADEALNRIREQPVTIEDAVIVVDDAVVNNGLLNQMIQDNSTRLPITELSIQRVLQDLQTSANEIDEDVEIDEDEFEEDLQDALDSIEHTNNTSIFLSIAEIKNLLTPILESLYPNNWDWNEDNHITIRFPKIRITNSKGNAHTIYNLFVRLKYDNMEHRFMSSMRGARSTYTQSEIISNYVHSHLQRSGRTRLGIFNNFCLGTSSTYYLLSDLATTLLKFGCETDLKLKFEILLMELENYVKWESIEGVPHVYMDKIGLGTLDYFSDTNLSQEASNVCKKLFNDMLKLNYVPKIVFTKSKKLNVISNEDLLTRVSAHTSFIFKVYRDETGDFYSTKNVDDAPLGETGDVILFKGNNIPVKIIEDIKIYEDTAGKDYAHPTIVKKCKNILRREISEVWGREITEKTNTYYATKERKVTYIGRSIFADIENVRDSIES